MVRAVNLTRDAGTQSEDKTSESAINQPRPYHQCESSVYSWDGHLEYTMWSVRVMY